jgi:acetyl esterase/lipase
MKRIGLLMVLFVLVAGGFAMGFGSGVATNTKAGTAYTICSDVGYGEGPQLLDLYLPGKTADEFRPAVVLIHGGGWAIGDKADARERQFAELMMDEGYVAISINYTLTAYEGEVWKSKRLKGGWPQNIRDCKNALVWIVKNAGELGIDTNRLAVMGGSAGGHLALLTGLSNGATEFGDGCLGDGTVRCIIDFYGIPDIRRWGGKAFIDEPEAAHPEIWAKASPMEHLTKKSPPILIVHGTEDPTVPITLSDEFAELLGEKGIPFEYIKVDGAKHSFGLYPPQQDLTPVVQKFLSENLK